MLIGDCMVKVKKDLTGMTFGRLKVICQADDYVSPSGKHYAQWLCECSCKDHNKVVVRGVNLTGKSQHTKSCGCLVSESLQKTVDEHLKKTNKYSPLMNDEYGDYYIGYCSNTGREFYVDYDDYDKIKGHCWYEHVHGGISKIESRVGNKVVSMHSFLGFKYYDHKDRNELNNRKHNLRLATQQENNFNKSVRSDNNSGITGVNWSKKCKKWYVQLQANGKRYTKYFDDFDESVKHRLLLELTYYGKFAPQRHLFQEYGINSLE